MARKEDAARSDSSSKIQVLPAAVLPGQMQSGHIGERRHIVTQRVPPHEFVYGSLTLIVETLNRPFLPRVDLRVPFSLQCLNSALTPTAHFVSIVTLHVITEFTEQTIW